ncbi:hypothetical protein [Methanosarcina horonobensis]|uniref:hypothetical protein n=1 Tax=Methanosarcina horonobensis TaxID=418008 RepID=UPI0022B93C7C|nr:hypothetical protein [Methanosarcina horonobensis]
MPEDVISHSSGDSEEKKVVSSRSLESLKDRATKDRNHAVRREALLTLAKKLS